MEHSPIELNGTPLNILANRRAIKWSRRELAGRVLWAMAMPLFRFSPRPIWAWRRVLLRLFGASVGAHVRVHPSARIMIPWNLSIGDFAAVGDRVQLYALGHIRIGGSVTVSQNAHICAGSHDYTRADMPLLKTPVQIGDGAWICADAFVGPNVTVGDHAIVGARAVAMRNVAASAIVIGNPARVCGKRSPLNQK